MFTALSDVQESALIEIILATVRQAVEGPPTGRGGIKKVSRVLFFYFIGSENLLFIVTIILFSVMIEPNGGWKANVIPDLYPMQGRKP